MELEGTPPLPQGELWTGYSSGFRLASQIFRTESLCEMSTSALYGCQGCALPTSEATGYLWLPTSHFKAEEGELAWLRRDPEETLLSDIKHLAPFLWCVHVFMQRCVYMYKYACGGLGFT